MEQIETPLIFVLRAMERPLAEVRNRNYDREEYDGDSP
jgi:hypothetical protein